MITIQKNKSNKYCYTATYFDSETGLTYEKITANKDISVDEIKAKPTYIYIIKEVHIDNIQPGDTVLHVDGEVRTVGRSNIGGDSFMGRTLFGDSYHSGHICKKVTFVTKTGRPSVGHGSQRIN